MLLNLYKQVHRVVGLVAFVAFVLSVLHRFFFPVIMRVQFKKSSVLKPDAPARVTWSQPYSRETHFYLFNVTNHKAIEGGAKPIVKEIGPYVYDVWQERVNIEDREEDDTVAYSYRRIHKFNPQKSNGLSDEKDEFIIAEYLRIMAGAAFYRFNPPLVFGASKAIDIIYGNPDSVFIKETAKTFIFDGLPIPCKGITNYFGKSLCNELRDNVLLYGLRDEDETYYTSVWGHFNGTYERERKHRISRGNRNISEIGQLVEYEDKTNFSVWNNSKRCDEFRGTDGTLFHPLISDTKKEDLDVVETLICRSLVYHYQSIVKYSGLKLRRYTTYFGTDGDKISQEKCYCPHPDRCFKKGVIDLTLCTKVPWVGSHPHFYLADQSYVDAVDGVKPDKEKHMMFMDVDPLTGVTVRSHVRVQFNAEMLPIPKYRLMKNFTTALLPIAWVDDITVLPDSYVDEIKAKYHAVKLSQKIRYSTMATGLFVAAICTYLELQFHKRSKTNPVTEMSGPEDEESKSDSKKKSESNGNKNNSKNGSQTNGNDTQRNNSAGNHINSTPMTPNLD